MITEDTITEHTNTTGTHTTFYLQAGDANAIPIIMLHGWPELSLSWRHQLPALAASGYRAIAPDMRGYGRSTCYPRHEDYAQQHIVADMLNLADALDIERAVWVGHDWGSPTVWNIAAKHADRCLGVANLCVPYATLEFGWPGLTPHIDRNLYREDVYPAGQWEYMRFYEESFSEATATFDADPEAIVRLLFRKGSPEGAGQVAGTAMTRHNGGWFQGGQIPDLPRDEDVISAADAATYAKFLIQNSFFGPDSYYMNHSNNAAYAGEQPVPLEMPVLFLHGRFDYTCETMTSTLAEPMRSLCDDLTEHVVDSGHWMAQEQPAVINRHLLGWLARFL
ncbi:MAG: alpha/beta hydrolase [Pseudomonadota bacterium]